MSIEKFMSKLEPVVGRLAWVDLTDAAAAKRWLEREVPMISPVVREIEAMFAKGIAEGWLCDREGGGAKFSRVAKPSPQHSNFSIDAVQLSGPGVWHKHTAGEIDLCFAASGKPKFDGFEPGWVVFAPGSEHIPTVSGGTMNILYFLPGGQLEWKRA